MKTLFSRPQQKNCFSHCFINKAQPLFPEMATHLADLALVDLLINRPGGEEPVDVARLLLPIAPHPCHRLPGEQRKKPQRS